MIKFIIPFFMQSIMKDFFLIFLLSSFILANLISQENTVGLLYQAEEFELDGYNLMYPNKQNSVFLINDCGQIINQWIDPDSASIPGTMAYLTSNGELLKSKFSSELLPFASFGAGGVGGAIEKYSWDNELLARMIIADSFMIQHHSLEIMPNGNVLAIAWQNYNEQEIIESGFDTIVNNQSNLWFETIIEISSDLDSIVWQWNSFDHIVQDFDSSKSNYGVVAEHPERININYQDFSFERADFMHMNNIDYHEETDQILLCVRNYNEVWIIDHSTSTDEASTSEGGLCNKGGDILYRWGNEKTYLGDEADEQILLYPHDANWIKRDNEFEEGILIFNNGSPAQLSEGLIFLPEKDSSQCSYVFDDGYLPQNAIKQIHHPEKEKSHSTHASSIQFIDDDKYLICAARQGRGVVVDNDNNLLWEYLVPMRNGFPIEQGEEISLSQNFTNQMGFYPFDFAGFEGKDLSPKNYLELNPNEEKCILTNINQTIESNTNFKVINNISTTSLIINSSFSTEYIIINASGQLIDQGSILFGINEIQLNKFQSGLYFLKVKQSNIEPIKFVVSF